MWLVVCLILKPTLKFLSVEKTDVDLAIDYDDLWKYITVLFLLLYFILVVSRDGFVHHPCLVKKSPVLDFPFKISRFPFNFEKNLIDNCFFLTPCPLQTTVIIFRKDFLTIYDL